MICDSITTTNTFGYYQKEDTATESTVLFLTVLLIKEAEKLVWFLILFSMKKLPFGKNSSVRLFLPRGNRHGLEVRTVSVFPVLRLIMESAVSCQLAMSHTIYLNISVS